MIPRRLIWLGGLVAVLAALPLAGAEPRRVLLVHSFGRDFAPFDAFSAVLRPELVRQSPEPVDVFEVSLESARFHGTVQERPLVDYLLALFSGRRLDLVVTIGGPAARFVQRHRPRLFPSVPLLVASTDQRQIDPAMLTANDAAVSVANDPRQVLESLLQLLPQTTNVAVVLGHSPIEEFWLGELRRELQPLADRVHFDWLNELSFGDMLQRCAALPARSAIFYVLLSVDVEGIPHLEERALGRLRAVANAPIFGLYDTQLGRGVVGGPLVSIEDLGRDTAAVAVRLLAGDRPSDLRIPPRGPGRPRFDGRELDRWGIREARLPAGSTVHFRQPTFWQLYRGGILAGTSLLILEAVLIAVLVANLTRRRRAERSLRESEERLSLAAAAAEVGFWMWDLSRDHVWATVNWRRMFGFSPDEPLVYESVLQRIHPGDRAEVHRAVEQAVEARGDYTGEYRVLLADGTLRWITARGRLEVTAPGNRIRMLGAAVDVTERRRAEEAARELSGRLIRSQEEERARLARELHDDITQRLARLAIDVGRCELGTPERSPAETAREVREGLVRLSNDVHALSYRLHPSVLEDLGLVEALKAEVERFTRAEGIAAEVTFNDLPESVPHDAALCLFRVTQESLRNVARHARGRRVDVLLRGLDGGLQLAVRDDGCGFDPAAHRARPSLGLASMRERVHLLGGELDVESAPGQGTTLLAWVPPQRAAAAPRAPGGEPEDHR